LQGHRDSSCQVFLSFLGFEERKKERRPNLITGLDGWQAVDSGPKWAVFDVGNPVVLL